jgi:hypothetical protein
VIEKDLILETFPTATLRITPQGGSLSEGTIAIPVF